MKRVSVDIGGTFTDLALEVEDRRFVQKILTTPAAPEQAVIVGLQNVLSEAGLTAGDLSLILHG
ncbi:MAG TPA: hypothetical protein EYQ81_10450, partial [Sneathiellales bacterium]|nr:hypothetical protein [Sneathiellales bacterium]